MRIAHRWDCEKGLQPQDVAAPATTAPENWLHMKDWPYGAFICNAHLTDAATAVFTVRQADNAAGANPVSIAALTVTLTGETGNTHEMGMISWKADEISAANATKPYVGIQCVTSDAGDDISATFIGFARYVHGGMNDTD